MEKFIEITDIEIEMEDISERILKHHEVREWNMGAIPHCRVERDCELRIESGKILNKEIDSFTDSRHAFE